MPLCEYLCFSLCKFREAKCFRDVQFHLHLKLAGINSFLTPLSLYNHSVSAKAHPVFLILELFNIFSSLLVAGLILCSPLKHCLCLFNFLYCLLHSPLILTLPFVDSLFCVFTVGLIYSWVSYGAGICVQVWSD